ncbi:MAG TPA: DUF6412 domain-containing protein [Streptosporangiaceae bacterium]|jgi:hypothetical protein|nr:DUF6412 domain-containing protein [Streptosporangiaceae bacterium]
MRSVSTRRTAAAVPLAILGAIAAAVIAACWQPAFSLPSGLMALGAVALAGAISALLARSAGLASALQAGPLLQRAAALRRKSRSTVFQRQLNPDAAGRARPRAPSAAPAAA